MNLRNFPKRLDSKTSSLRIAVPENLDLALEGLIRKVLREQPKTDDIYAFAADYFETLLKIRDKAGAKVTAAQLCPFHNDEDAHEMIKLAGTFTKPKLKNDEREKMKKPMKKKEPDAKINKRTKGKETAKDKQPAKQVTPDLIKKLPTVTKPDAEVVKKTQSQGHDGEEATPEKEEEFLASDPIKELVEKELMMEADGNKTDGNDKTGNQNAQGEEKPLENGVIDNKEKHEEREENEKTNTEIGEKAENEKTQTELTKTSEEGTKEVEQSEKVIEDVKGESESSTKEENVKKDVTEPNEEATGETQKQTEGGHMIKEEVEKLSETVTEPAEVQNEKKEGNKTHKEGNKKMETFPVSESGKKVMDVLPSEKLPEISEDITEKNPDAAQTEPEQEQEFGNTETSPTEITPQPTSAEQKPNNSQIPTETKDQQQPNTNSTEPVTKQVQETLASIPEHISLELPPNEATQPETDLTSTEAEENQKAEEEPPVNAQPTGDNEQTHTGNQEKEPELETTEQQRENSEDDNPKKTTEPEQNVTVNEDKTFGEIIKNNEEEETSEEIKVNETEKPEETAKEEKIPGELTKAEEREKPQESAEPTVDDSDKPTETTAEENIKLPTGDKSPEENESTQVEDKTPDPGTDTGESGTNETEKQEEVKNERTNTEDNRESDNQETSTKAGGDMLELPQAQPETQEAHEESTEEPKTTPEVSANETEVPGDELCSVVDIKQVPRDDEMTVGEAEPAAEGTQTVQEQELIETKEGDELRNVMDVPKEGETLQKLDDEVENMQPEQTEELCRVVDNPKLDVTDEAKIQETEKEEVRPEMKEESNSTPAEDNTDSGKSNENTPAEGNTDSGKPHENTPAEGNTDSGKPHENTPAEDNTDSEKPNESTPDSVKGEEKTGEPTETNTRHIIKVEEVEIPTKPDEIQIKTIQTHYYDTLQVPETVTREYRVHNLPHPTALLAPANFLQPNGLDENMNATPENIPAVTTQQSTPEQVHIDTPAPVIPLDLETQKTDSDDLLDLMTPTSGYSMNLSEVSLLTVSELFLDSEKRFSSLEKEEIRYVTPNTETTNGQQEVEEVIEKTVLPSNITAVPVPPRDAEEINEEANVQTTGNVKEEKKEEDKSEGKPENESTEGSSNGRSVDSDIPFISVEVKTVIETLDDEEEKNGGRPEVKVKVRATIDVQDDVGMLQHEGMPVEEGTVTSEGKSEEKPEERSSVEEQSRDEEKQGMFSSGVEGSSSLDSDVTGSSAATEIKRTDSSKRNLSSVRSLVSAQSIDLEKRNPLLKTRSLSNFRHGVTDFEVWNKIEKELEDAAIKIQSKFRGYKTRKKLQRGNAVQITTEESSVSTTPVEAEPKDEGQQPQQQSTGEFHDSIILSEHPR